MSESVDIMGNTTKYERDENGNVTKTINPDGTYTLANYNDKNSLIASVDEMGYATIKAYDKNGQADIYWNCIIGALRRHYDYPQIEALFLAFQQYEDSDVYEGLLWLGLENCVYQQELAERPVLEKLRRDYASAFVAEYSHIGLDDYKLYDCMALAHYMRVLGQEPKMSRYDMKLLDELEFGPEMLSLMHI